MKKSIRKYRYDKIHSRAKVLNTCIISIFFTLSSYFFTYGPFWGGVVAGLITIELFQHGNNHIGWLLEYIKGWRHLHKKY